MARRGSTARDLLLRVAAVKKAKAWRKSGAKGDAEGDEATQARFRARGCFRPWK